jgi:signal transduction histidine kinase
MEKLLARDDRPIPAAYWIAAVLGAGVVVVCYATTYWFPETARPWAEDIAPRIATFGSLAMAVFGATVGLAVASAVPLALRWPWLALVLAVLPGIPSLFDGTDLHFGVIATLAAVAVTAGWRRPMASCVAIGVAILVTWAWLLSDVTMVAPFRTYVLQDGWTTGHTLSTGMFYLVILAAVLAGALGLRVGVQTDLERRSLASRSEAVEEQAAVVGERARLARDLHDVVAHHVSLIAVRAETAPYTHPEIGDQARGVLGDIAADARLALDELRGVLGILGRSGAAERAPQPTWSDITALVERTRSAGVDIEVVGNASAEVGSSAGYAAYRVVQEALTNARKHAPGARVTVDLDATSQLLTVLVSTPLSASARPSEATGGQGLVGMRERVEALGGRLLSGPVGEDFVVEAILPRGFAEGAA